MITTLLLSTALAGPDWLDLTGISTLSGPDFFSEAPGNYETWVGNTYMNSACDPWRSTFALSSEVGHYMATRLVPNRRPMRIEEVRYMLFHGTHPLHGVDCSVVTTHDVVLYKGFTTGGPPSNPIEVARVTVSGGTAPSAADFVWKVATLPSPVTIDFGEAVWVAVEMQAQTGYTGLVCAALCDDDGGEVEHGYWSNAVSAPYPWAELETWGITGDHRIAITGEIRL